MGNDVVNDGLWGHHALPVEGELPAGRTGGPTMAKLADVSTPRLHADLRGKVRDAPTDPFEPLDDVVVSECRLCSRDLPKFNDVSPEHKATIFEL